MATIDKNKTQVFSCTIKGLYCDEFNCRGQAEYFIGNPSSPTHQHYKLCKKHKQELVNSILEEEGDKIEKEVEDKVKAKLEAEAEKEEKYIEQPSMQGQEEKFICKHCGKDYFISKEALLKHERNCYHHPERVKARQKAKKETIKPEVIKK